MRSLRAWLGTIYNTSRYLSLTDRERARAIYTISTGILLIAALIILVATDADSGEKIYLRLLVDATIGIPLFFLVFLLVGSFILTRAGRLNLGALGIVLAWLMSFNAATALGGLYSASSGIIVVTMILLAGVLLRVRGLILGVVLTLLTYVAGLAMRASVPRPPTQAPAAELAILIPIGVIFAGLVYVFIRLSRLSREETTQQTSSEQLRFTEIASQIAQRVSSRMALQEVLNQTVTQITTNFPDIYHAQIFLVDESGMVAQLQASTGEVGQRLLARQHSLNVGSQSVIGDVTSLGQPVVARAGDRRSTHRRNELLPQTAVEAAFPLKIGDSVIGALDLQSQNSYALTESDIPIFQTLADQLAIAIDNARLFEETTARLRENERLAADAQVALQQVEHLNRQLTEQMWSDYLGARREDVSLQIDLASGSVQYDPDWTPELLAALNTNEVIEHETADNRMVAVPLRVRGEVIGAMEFELDADGSLTAEDRQLVEEISERFGLAAETTRLFDESQRTAQREALVNEIGARLQGTGNVETTLAEAARSLQQVLQTGHVSIRLGAPPAANGKDGGA